MFIANMRWSFQVPREEKHHCYSYASAFAANTRTIRELGKDMLRGIDFQHCHAPGADDHWLC